MFCVTVWGYIADISSTLIVAISGRLYVMIVIFSVQEHPLMCTVMNVESLVAVQMPSLIWNKNFESYFYVKFHTEWI